MTLAYLNGHYQPLAETKISALDRGFLFGDGVYEVIPVYQSSFLLGAKEHLDRLDNSLREIKIEPPLSHSEWQTIFSKLLAETPHDITCSIYLQITRGADKKRGHLFPDPPVAPTVIAFINHSPVKTKAEVMPGLRVTTHPDIRWNNCFIKAITLLPNLLMMQQAKVQGTDETILHREQRVTEACSSNVFIVKDGVIKTTPLSTEILPGITRQLVLNILKQNNIPYQETHFSLDELYQADEVWLTSSTKEVAPVVMVDKTTIGNGTPGPMWEKVYTLYQHYVEAQITR